MSFKTVLVDLSTPDRYRTVLEIGEIIAQQHVAKLIGVCIVPRMQILSDNVREIERAVSEYNRNQAERDVIRSEFEQRAAALGLEFEWDSFDTDPNGNSSAFLSRCRTAGLLIACQSNSDWGGISHSATPEMMALASGRPVLIVPNSGGILSVGRRVLVAWNDTREATRATFDAIPILARAEEVNVTWFSPHRTGISDHRTSLNNLVRSLREYGVNASADASFATDTSLAEEILAHAAKMNADMLAMGCYGHSRAREFILGGTSRAVLRKMTTPVLMSH